MKVYLGTRLDDGAQFLVTHYDDGTAEVATRSSSDTRERWSAPTPLALDHEVPAAVRP